MSFITIEWGINKTVPVIMVIKNGIDISAELFLFSNFISCGNHDNTIMNAPTDINISSIIIYSHHPLWKILSPHLYLFLVNIGFFTSSSAISNISS